jgi:class 3 adenylate cyclase/tetratricopeptide (TPR) repeat protein
MAPEQQQLQAGIAALEAQRALLGDAVVDAAIAGLRAKLIALAPETAPRLNPAQALKQVSILFMDVVGSTTLSQRLDPEAVGMVMDGALSRATAVVEVRGGRVLQYAGDNILAAFGAGEAREDDAERAVQCGLALLELGRTLGSEVQSAHGHAGFDFRVGIHTGGVLLGGGVDADGSIRGMAVNVAARMEQTAPAGALRISHDTYAQVRGLFEVDAQDAFTVKGLDTVVQTYLVRRAKPRQFRIRTRGVEGVATRMIGRGAELLSLQTAFMRLFDARKLAVVTVVADAGIGKSRLLYEFEAWSEARPEAFFLFRGRASPQTGTQAYGLLRDILAWRFQILDDDPIETARSKMEHGVMPLFEHDDGVDLAEAHAHLLGHLIGIEWSESRHIKGILDDPKQIRNRAFHAAAQIFRRVSAGDGSPVILQLEDLHWADGESLDFLNYLIEVSPDVPLLVLGFTRPPLFERRQGWSGTAGIHQRVDLHPLDKDMSRMLAAELLNKLPEIPAALTELLTSVAEGNPFYMEELLKMLIDQGAIETGEPWVVNAERLLLTKVPATLTGVLQARLDGLPAAVRRALQQASVIGTVFWDQALAAVDPLAAEQLPALVQRGLALPRADAPLEGLREYAFCHQLLHQVTYGTVLRRDKRDCHARVAQWLAAVTERGGLRAGDFLSTAAEHFEHAGDEARAGEFHARAAEHGGQRFAHERVMASVGRALTLLGQPEPAHAALRWRLLSARELTLGLQARRDEQAADLVAMAQLAEWLSDDRRRADVARRRGTRAMRMADWPAQERAAREGLEYATRAGDDNLRLTSIRQLASVRLYQGNLQASRELALQGLTQARGLKLRGVEARLLNVLSAEAETRGDLVLALDLTRQGQQIYLETGDRLNEAIGLSNLGGGLLNLGDLAQAQRNLDAALRLLRANGDRVVQSAALAHLSALALWQGDESKALVLARSALDVAMATQARNMEVIAAIRLGDAEHALGHLEAARQAYSHAQARAVEIDNPTRFDASAGLTQVAMSEEDATAAMDALRPVLDHAAAGGLLEGAEYPRRVELTCYEALKRAGDMRAAGWLTRAHTALLAQYEAITDFSLRQGFLQNIPHHREIVAAWANCSPGDTKTGVIAYLYRA